MADRLRQYEQQAVPEVRQALDTPADLAGPTGSRGVIRNSKGEELYQDHLGNWKNSRTHKFSDPPDTEAMTSGFRDADLAAARGRTPPPPLRK